MTTRRTRTLLGGAAILVLVALTACVGPSTSTPTSTPAPTRTVAAPEPTPSTTQTPPAPADPAPVAAGSIVLGGPALSVSDASGAPQGEYAYEGPADGVVTSLTALLGPPQTLVHQNEKCIADSVDNVWGGMTLNYLGLDAAGSTAFRVSVRGAVPGADVQTPFGARVGESWPDYVAQVADHPSTTGVYEGLTWVELIDSEYTPWGATAGTLVRTDDSATISWITAPTDLGHDC